MVGTERNSRPTEKPSGPGWRFLLATTAFAIGAVLGAGVWWASPRLTGEAEPWDLGGAWPYFGVMFAGGLFLALLVPPRFAPAGPLGLCAGQIVYTALFYHPSGPIILPSFLAVAIFGLLPALLGAGAGAAVRFHWDTRPR
jgi:hypothetical protein